jgi:hypothetical protein
MSCPCVFIICCAYINDVNSACGDHVVYFENSCWHHGIKVSRKITETEPNPHHITDDHLDEIGQSNENYGLMMNGKFKQCVLYTYR